VPSKARIACSLLPDALLVALVALLCFQALRRYCGDRYMVPTDSMEPFLHGDPLGGDIVFVDKLWRGEVRVHDVVVVRHPTGPGQQLVKRVAACGDDQQACWIELRDGDVWLGPDRQHLRREAKDPLASRELRVPWCSWPAAAAQGDLDLLELGSATPRDGGLEVPPLDGPVESLLPGFAPDAFRERRGRGRILPSGFVGTARAVDASYVDLAGARGHEGDDIGVADCGLDLELDETPAALLGLLSVRSQAWLFHWQPAAGRLALFVDGAPAFAAPLPAFAEGARRVEFGLLDDRLFFAVDGRRDALWCEPRPSDPDAANGGAAAARSHVGAAALGDRPLRLVAMTVFRDLFRWREGIAGLPGQPGDWPRFVPPGTWFLLGDNAFDSRDSRHFDAVPSTAFVGRPRAVLGPWPRGRWLP
jgi:hypothetical protein